MKPRTLTGGIALLLGAATVLLLGAAAVLMDHLLDTQMQRRFDVDLLTQANALAALVESSPHGLAVDTAIDPPARLLAGDAQGSYLVQCANGGRLQSTPPPAAAPAGWARGAGTQPSFADIGDGARAQRATWFGFTLPLADGARPTAVVECRLLFMQSRRALDDILVTIDLILLVIPLLALLAVLALSPSLVRRGLRPLTRLRESMRDIGPQRPGQRLHSTGTRELEPLVASFNEVLTRMDEVLARERRFTDALAHETRTRLAELRALVDVERRYPSGRPPDALLDEIGAIGKELEGTVAGLLLLTRLDAGLESPDWRPIEPAPWVARQVARVAALANRRQLRLDVAPPARAVALVADASLLDIVLGNLLGNACEYAPTGGTVRIGWDEAALTVDNAAPELAADEVACLGQRFWSKQQGRGGHTGLGLALAGAAAAAMGFRLTFALRHGQQLRATLAWRRSEAVHQPHLETTGQPAEDDGAARMRGP